MHLAYLHKKVAPLLAVIGKQTALLGLLGNGQVSHAVGIDAPLEITEVGFRQELVPLAVFLLELPAHEDVLLVQGVPFA